MDKLAKLQLVRDIEKLAADDPELNHTLKTGYDERDASFISDAIEALKKAQKYAAAGEPDGRVNMFLAGGLKGIASALMFGGYEDASKQVMGARATLQRSRMGSERTAARGEAPLGRASIEVVDNDVEKLVMKSYPQAVPGTLKFGDVMTWPHGDMIVGFTMENADLEDEANQPITGGLVMKLHKRSPRSYMMYAGIQVDG